MVIYDANNGTRAARQTLAEKFDAAGIHVVMLGMAFFSFASYFVQITIIRTESICDNKEIIETNIRNVKISSPDVRMVLSLL